MELNPFDFAIFITAHEKQLKAASVPKLCWQTLYIKLKAGEVLFEANKSQDKGMLFRIQHDLLWRAMCCAASPLQPNDPKNIYLIDHIWTYEIAEVQEALQRDSDLVKRMTNLMAIETKGLSKDKEIHKIVENMWRFIQTAFGTPAQDPGKAKPQWFMMDEFGSRIQHSTTPNFRVVPFFYKAVRKAYSIMWPLMEVKKGDEVRRDFVFGERDIDVRRARLIPWSQTNIMSIKFEHAEPDISHFKTGREDETWPEAGAEFQGLPVDRNLKVYLENSDLGKFLTDKRFDVVDDPDEADILWYCSVFDDFKTLSKTRPKCLINQFPCQNVLTSKNLLAVTARRAAVFTHIHTIELMLASNPKWMPETYNLSTELLKFVSFFQTRSKRMLDNHWICKPLNLASNLDTHITQNVERIIRVLETGPKIICKYVENPLLFYRTDIKCPVKFELRFIVLLTSAKPVQFYVHEVFSVRFANKGFSLECLDNQGAHFTVDETSTENPYQLRCDVFISRFESQNPDYKWIIIVNDIYKCLKKLFEAAVSLPPPKGLCPSPQSRAMYTVDVLLSHDQHISGKWNVQPKIVDVNFGANVTQACKYHPSLVNEIFTVLFMDETSCKPLIPL